jgi:prepilin-type N-terminal cleavage/methylation domain-containing protein
MKTQKGMSLNEILVAVVIVGILATLALPMVQNYFERSESEVCKTNLKTLKTALDIYAMEHETVPGTISQLAPYVDRAYAQVMRQPGAWKARVAYASLQARSWWQQPMCWAQTPASPPSTDISTSADNQKFLLFLAKGDRRLITCPKSKGPFSYALNSGVLRSAGNPISSRAYQELTERDGVGNFRVLVADCGTSGVISSSDEIDARHIHHGGVVSPSQSYGHAAGVKAMLKYQGKQLVEDKS